MKDTGFTRPFYSPREGADSLSESVALPPAHARSTGTHWQSMTNRKKKELQKQIRDTVWVDAAIFHALKMPYSFKGIPSVRIFR